MNRQKAQLIGLAVAVLAACGGPGTVINPPPTQSVQFYFAGTEDSGALHVHVNWVQTGHNIVLLSPCTPQDDCRIYPFSTDGNTQLGSTFAVDLSSGSGTFADPGITFTVTTVTGKTFSFAGTVTTSGTQVQMVGTLSGATHPASRLVLDKQNQ